MYSEDPETLRRYASRLLSHGYDEIARGNAMLRLAEVSIVLKGQIPLPLKFA
jgi:hypothetical protein